MLKKRVVTAFLLLPLVVIVVWFNEPIPWLAVFTAIWGIVAAREFYQAVIQSNQKVEPLTYFGLIWILFLILSPLLMVIILFCILDLNVEAAKTEEREEKRLAKIDKLKEEKIKSRLTQEEVEEYLGKGSDLSNWIRGAFESNKRIN